ncbi:MAG TPA: lipopolysaccharide biosynthesis protein RfbH [Candidatus Omnitrophota bacterium]|nr:lipopolysaccharide biosynthesis protein RfbH [Candidatus Omnitrophota bacterium]
MNKQEAKLRREVLNKVTDFYNRTNKDRKFVPRVTPIHYAGRVYDSKELLFLTEAVLDFWLTEGRFTKRFEEGLAKFLGIKYCLLTNSGSSANLLAVSALTSPLLKSRRLLPGDEVITTACGFPTTLNPIIQNRLIPVFVDVDTGSYNIQVSKLKNAISKKTKAIFIAHTLGNPADLDSLLKIAKKYNLWLIEDNCDALGSKYNDRYTGTFGDISTCSFYPAHHITMGEGGAVLTNDPLLRKIIVSFRDWGRDCHCATGRDNACGERFSQRFAELPYGYDHKYVYSHIGYNLKVTDLQAAIGCAQLAKLPGFIKDRKENFNFLYSGFKQYEEYFILPQWLKKSEPSWFGLPLLIKDSTRFERRELVGFLEKNKISTRMAFGGNLVKQPAYRNLKYRVYGGLKNTDLIMNNLFWLGVYPGISRKETEFILNVFAQFISAAGGSAFGGKERKE